MKLLAGGKAITSKAVASIAGAMMFVVDCVAESCFELRHKF